MCYVGPKEKGQEYLNAISSWDGERPLLNEVNEKSYLNQQDSVAQVLRGKRKCLRSVLLLGFRETKMGVLCMKLVLVGWRDRKTMNEAIFRSFGDDDDVCGLDANSIPLRRWEAVVHAFIFDPFTA